jgi:hypothetical protein
MSGDVIPIVPVGDTSVSASGGTLTNTYSGSESATGTSSASSSDTSTTDSQTILGDTSTSTSNSVINSSNPAVVAALEALVSTATTNANNATSNAAGVVSGLLQSAQDSFASVFGQQGASGVYNASSTQIQENNTIARTAADAASAVLGYQTQEQQIAASGLNQLLTALGTQTTLGSTKSNTDTTTLTSGNVDVTNLFSGLSYGKTNTSQNSSTDTHSNSNTASTIVCTEMLTHGLMQRKEYVTVHAHYKEHYSDHGKKAYHFWGRRIVSKLRRDRTSKVSRFLLSLFSARTNFVCWRLTGVPPLSGARIILGFLAYWFIHICCIPPGFIYLCNNLLKQREKK